MTTPEMRAETRFNYVVLGSWWAAVALLGGLRLWRGDMNEAILLLTSASFTALLGVALAIDRANSTANDGPDVEALRLQKATMLFSVIAIATVVGCAFLNGAIWWAALECAALLWILPAQILPLAQAYLRKRASSRSAQAQAPL